ncbi:hypothetical protein D3C87_2197790 [compost metagenome]
MLPDDEIGPCQSGLLGCDINIEIRIQLIEGADFHPLDRPYLFEHPLIRMGVVRIRMGVDDEYHD